MKKRLYVAYGSNLNMRQMKYRCPTAKLYGTGRIENYELQFKGHPVNAYATIAPKAGASVPVAVWEIRPMDEYALDRYEGYPSHYFKQNVPVQLDGKEVDAMVYIMNPRMQFGLPSREYYQTVHEGYKDCKLDTGYLKRAVMNSAQSFYSSAVRPGMQFRFRDYGEDDLSEGTQDEDEDPTEEQEETDPLASMKM